MIYDHHHFNSRLNIYSLFVSLIINFCLLFLFSTTLKIKVIKNIIPEQTANCFECEIIKETLKEESAPKGEEINNVSASNSIIKEKQPIKEPIIENKIDYMKNKEKKQPMTIKKIALSKVVETEKNVANKSVTEFATNINEKEDANLDGANGVEGANEDATLSSGDLSSPASTNIVATGKKNSSGGGGNRRGQF